MNEQFKDWDKAYTRTTELLPAETIVAETIVEDVTEDNLSTEQIELIPRLQRHPRHYLTLALFIAGGLLFTALLVGEDTISIVPLVLIVGAMVGLWCYLTASPRWELGGKRLEAIGRKLSTRFKDDIQ